MPRIADYAECQLRAQGYAMSMMVRRHLPQRYALDVAAARPSILASFTPAQYRRNAPVTRINQRSQAKRRLSICDVFSVSRKEVASASGTDIGFAFAFDFPPIAYGRYFYCRFFIIADTSFR